MFKRAFKSRKHLINLRFQFKYTLLFIGVCSLIYIALAYFIYKTTLDVTQLLNIQNVELANHVHHEDVTVLQYIVAIFFLQALGLFVLGITITHKIIGPVHRLIQLIETINDGHLPEFHGFRKNDEMIELTEPVKKLIVTMEVSMNDDLKLLNDILPHIPDHSHSDGLIKQIKTRILEKERFLKSAS